MSVGSLDLAGGEGLHDGVARPVGDQPPANHDEQPVDQRQQLGAVGADEQRAVAELLGKAGAKAALGPLSWHWSARPGR
jgi:hypothetical protein